MGQISNTGVGGLTLGGGFGWLSHRFGMACDNLIALDLVTADGELRRVSAEENPDLFWAVRGGGGNFGVATSFEFRLHKVGPQVLAGHVSYPRARARDVIAFYADFASNAPRELDVDLSLEPGPDGQSGVAIYLCYSGDVHAGEKALEPLRKLGKPLEDAIRIQDYVVVQRQFDGPSPDPNNHYLKGGFVREFSPGGIDRLAHDGIASKELNLYFENSCGAVADVEPTATAFPYRHAITNMLLVASWPDAAENERRIAAARARWDTLVAFTEGYYSNLNDTDQKSTDRNYGVNHARLVQVKKKYDPLNLFRLNSNIRPT
jgi:FAD/FMN-containing dehydrogenase